MYGLDTLCEFSMVLFEIPRKISYTYSERCVIYWWMKIYELLVLRVRNVWCTCSCAARKIHGVSYEYNYTAHQFYGIALPVYPCCLTSGGNRLKFQYKKKLTTDERVLMTLWKDSLTLEHHLYPIPVSLYLSGADLSNCTKCNVSHLCRSHPAAWWCFM